VWDEVNQRFLEMDAVRVRDLMMDFIKTHHEETRELIGDIQWVGEDITPPGLVGSVTFMSRSY